MWLVLNDERARGLDNLALYLPQGITIVGRGSDCNIVLRRQSVSRKHLRIERHDDTVTFRDLDSKAGVLLDGEPSKSGMLKGGSVLTIADFTLTFHEEALLPKFDDEDDLFDTTGDKEAFDWSPFGLFLEGLRSTGDPRKLLERLLNGLVELFSAERGFVLLKKESEKNLIPVATYQLDDQESFLAVSSTVYRRALEEGRLVFIANSLEDSRVTNAASLNEAGWPRTIYCAPLIAEGETFGVVYMDQAMQSRLPRSDRRRLFETVTGLAAQLLGAARTRKSLIEATGRVRALNILMREGEKFIPGESEAGRELQSVLKAAAPQDVSVLITGETGTGKEMVARTIHRMSSRSDGPFVPVNCAALPREIIEAELFGSEKGAYTGATERRIGRFELASGGTLFLDEVGELPLDFQVKLLRVLQDRTITRLGSAETIPVDFRLISATNANLDEAISRGLFRQDFYYRINVFRIELQPLRSRREDIMPLAHHFLEHFSTKYGRHIDGFTDEATKLVMNYPWMGNIRELRNAIERAVVIERESLVTPRSLPLEKNLPRTLSGSDLAFWDNLPEDFATARDIFIRTFLERSLDRYRGNISAVAKATGMPRRTIYNRMEKLGLIKGGR